MRLPSRMEMDLIVKLNRLTSLGKIEWHVEDAPESVVLGTDSIVPLFMRAEYKEQRFGLYICRYRWYDGDNDKNYWTEKSVVAIIDQVDRVLWESEFQTSALRDLMENARSQVAGVDNIINGILDENDD